MSGPRRAALLGAGVAVIAACSNVLGLSEYTGAARALCDACDNIPGCEATLDDKLAAASDEEREAWLASYEALECAESACDTTALRCFYTAPGNCAGDGAPCPRAEACCKYDFDSPAKGSVCCAGTGDGACCDACNGCDAMLSDTPPPLSTLCMELLPTYDAVEACRTTKCSGALCEQFGGDCVACALQRCQAEIKACNMNQAL